MNANQSISDILDFFGNDITRYAAFLSRFLDKNYNKYFAATAGKEKKEEKEEEKVSPITVTDEKGKKTDIESSKDLIQAQQARRRASLANIQKVVKSEDGRKMSNVEKQVFIVDEAIRLAEEEEEEEQALYAGISSMFQEDDPEEEDEEKNVNWEHLPYVPVPDDPIDEALAIQLNTFEIDIEVKRLPSTGGKKARRSRAKKVFYRIEGVLYHVRMIHGVLLLKQNDDWIEMVKKLKELGAKK